MLAEDFSQGPSECCDAEVCAHGVGEPPGEHLLRVPVDVHHQVHGSLGVGNVGDIGRPGLIGMINHDVS